MYKVNMHITPAKVRARACELLEKDGRELIHLAYKSVLEKENKWFVLISKDEANLIDSYAVCCFNSKTNALFYNDYDLTYPEALIKMGEIINN